MEKKLIYSGIDLAGLACCQLHKIQGDGRWEPPNFILILTDDLGYGDLNCYNQSMIETPHLDAEVIKEEGQ